MNTYAHEIPAYCSCYLQPGRSGEFFRIVKNKETVDHADFIPVAVLDPSRLEKEKTEQKKCCLYSISLYTDYERAKKIQKQYKRLGKFIAKAQLSCSTGDHIPAEKEFSFHYDWFPYQEVNFLTLFSVVQ